MNLESFNLAKTMNGMMINRSRIVLGDTMNNQVESLKNIPFMTSKHDLSRLMATLLVADTSME